MAYCCEIVANGYRNCSKCYESEKGIQKLEEIGVDLSKKLSRRELQDIMMKLKN